MLPLFCALAMGAAAQTGPVSAKVVAQPLRDAVLARLDFTGPAAQRAALESIVARALDAPTGREVASAFVASGARVGVWFQAFSGTEIYESEPGVPSFAANHAAHALRTETSASVALNDACLTVPGEHAAALCASQFAHELFGHVLGWAEASPAVRKVYWLYDDELLARMVTWNVELELSGSIRDPQAWCDADDPVAAQKLLPSVYPSSSWGLTRAELRAPVESLRAHVAFQKDDAGRAQIEGELEFFSGDGGPEHVADARAAADDPLFDRLEARLDGLRRRLLASDGVFKAETLCPNYR